MLKTLIDRPISVTMAMLVAVVLGVVSMRLLPVSLIPDVAIPYITVQVADPSLSAREMDESVVKPLRGQLIQINGLKEIVSESRDGTGTVRLSFNHGADIDYLFIEVNEKIDRCMSLLPGTERPKVFKASATDIPAFFINVTLSPGSGEGFAALSRFCREVVAKRIEQLPEVAMVDISGTVGEEILILPDEARLSQAGMSFAAFESAVASADIRLGALTIRDGEYRYNVKFDTRVAGAEDIGNIYLRAGERLLQVRDLATVATVPAKRTGLVRSDGKEAVSLAVIKQSDARMAALKKNMAGLMDSFREDYPQMDFSLTRDQTELLEYSIGNLIRNILLGVLLACLVIFLFMRDFRSPMLVCLTMPTALVLSMFAFYLAGMSLNIISLSGLLLGVGMMADNTIILIDNITARWQRGDSLRDAVLKGTAEVRGPMLSSVLTTCAVFIPLVFAGGIAGALFYDEAMAVTIVLLCSYAVTVTVIPVFYWWWYKGDKAFTPHPLLGRISFDAPLHSWDSRRMAWWLDHRHLAWVLIVFSALGTALLAALVPKERLPEMTVTESILHIDWNDRISAEENEARTAALEAVVAADALQLTSLVGVQQYALGHSGDQGVQESAVYLRCRDMATLRKAEEKLADHLHTNAPGAVWRFAPAGNIFDMVFADGEAPLVARLRSLRDGEIRLEPLRGAISAIRRALPGVTVPSVGTKTDVLFTADPERMALYGVSYAELASVLKNALNENRLFTIVQGTRTLPVVTGSDKESLTAILEGTFLEKGGIRIPATELLRQSYAEDLKTIVSGAEGNYFPVPLAVEGRSVKRAIAAIREAVRRDGNFELSFSGGWFSSRKMAAEMVLILLVALALLYLILAAQFESLLQPLIILLEIVVDIFGAFAVLGLLGVSINLMSLIGLVVVTGIVINDSILKIDSINRLRKEGVPLREAVLTASSRRMKAILMTSLTTILAVVPFLARGSMGADLQYPMSLVIIAGMAIGTLVSLFVVPAIYYSLYARKDRA